MPIVLITIISIAAAVLLFAYLAGLTRVHLLRIHTEITINATKTVVWQVLTNFNAYPAWNPLMIKVAGDVKPRSRMDWSSRINGRVRQYNACIDSAEPLQELAWTGPISSLGRIFFWGEHRFIIQDAPGEQVRLINTERFGGLLTIPLRSFLQGDVRASYDAANQALKKRAETR